jgi:hypothetical protein
MRSLIPFAILLLPAIGVAAPTTSGLKAPNLRCPGAPQAQWTGQKGASVSKLGDLPPGNLMLTVVREIDGCPQDTVIRTNYGGKPAQAPKRK